MKRLYLIAVSIFTLLLIYFSCYEGNVDPVLGTPDYYLINVSTNSNGSTNSTNMTTTTTLQPMINITLSPINSGHGDNMLNVYLYSTNSANSDYISFTPTVDTANDKIYVAVPFISGKTLVTLVRRFSTSADNTPTGYKIQLIHSSASGVSSIKYESNSSDFGCATELPTQPYYYNGFVDEINGQLNLVFNSCDSCCNLSSGTGLEVDGTSTISHTWYSDYDYFRFILQ